MTRSKHPLLAMKQNQKQTRAAPAAIGPSLALAAVAADDAELVKEFEEFQTKQEMK